MENEKWVQLKRVLANRPEHRHVLDSLSGALHGNPEALDRQIQLIQDILGSKLPDIVESDIVRIASAKLGINIAHKIQAKLKRKTDSREGKINAYKFAKAALFYELAWYDLQRQLTERADVNVMSPEETFFFLGNNSRNQSEAFKAKPPTMLLIQRMGGVNYIAASFICTTATADNEVDEYLQKRAQESQLLLDDSIPAEGLEILRGGEQMFYSQLPNCAHVGVVREDYGSSTFDKIIRVPITRETLAYCTDLSVNAVQKTV